MSELYRRISVRMWGDADFRRLSAPQPNARDLWIYILTGPHTTPFPGLFEASREELASKLKWPQEDFLRCLSELIPEGSSIDGDGAQKAFFEADWEAGVVWLPNAIEHNPPQSPNVVISWKWPFDLIPECDLKIKALRRLKSWCESKGEGFAKAFNETFGKAFKKTRRSDTPTSPRIESSSKSNSKKHEHDQHPERAESGAAPPDDPGVSLPGEAENEQGWTARDQRVKFIQLFEGCLATTPSMGGKHVDGFHAKVLRTAELQRADPAVLFAEAVTRWLARPLNEAERKHPYACFEAAWGDLTAKGERAAPATGVRPVRAGPARLQQAPGTTGKDFEQAEDLDVQLARMRNGQ